jgi:DNA (cytosine-5)-methyltransferase 1
VYLRSKGIAVPNLTETVRVRQRGLGDDWQETQSGLVVPQSYTPEPPRPVAVDLFAGAGGFSLGVIQAGFRVAAAVDNDAAAAMTYTYNLGAYPMQFHYATREDRERLEKQLQREMQKGDDGVYRMITAGGGWRRHQPDVPGVEHFFLGDVRKLTGRQILEAIGMERGEVDLVCGGPPCQGFSSAGQRDIMDPRNSLVFEFARLVLEMMPRSLIMENVPGMLTMRTVDGTPVIDELCSILEKGGFGVARALKETLTHNAAAGMAMRGVRGRGREEKKEDSAEQLALQF